MGINVHRGDVPEALVHEFAAMLRGDPADVFTPEVVVVPARGVERWLAQQLSHELGATAGNDGVCAGLEIMAPQSLISLLLGRDHDDPWQADQLVWPTLDAIDELVGSVHFDALTHHLGAGPEITDDPRAEWERKARQSRRYAVARRIAGLFAAYARERPRLLTDWEAGEPSDGQGEALPDDFLWQPILWRRTVDLVRERRGVAESVVERHRRVVDQLSSGSGALDLPPRLSFFGYTRLAEAERELVVALGACRDLHLWLPHPSPQLWADLDGETAVGPRAADRTAWHAHHPLLATLGRDVRELQAVLSSDGVTVHEPRETTTSRIDRLALLQADIRANRAPDQTRTTTADDLSIQVHACHGPARQVEVLREVLTGLLADAQGALQPRDVLVMCPDIETFAPLIQATFGLSLAPAPGTTPTSYHPGQQLRVQLADRATGATNPLIDLAHRVVQLVAGRLTASEVLDFASHESVRARFGFDEQDLDRVGRWVADAGVRWGYDAGHRGEYQLPDLDTNTWTRGLDRIALGVAVAADTDGPSAARVPVDDIGSRDTEAVGRFLELMERLKRAADAVRGSLTARAWMQWLRDTLEALADTPPDEQWQFAQLTRDLAAIGETAGDGTALRLNDLRVLLDQRWGARPTRANFRTGAITVCTMVPMRSVPHKVVVVLGVDDGVYPRSPVVDGDDVLARRPRVGERDPRSEDRQLLLDAVMAAGEHVVAIYSGFDEHNGHRRPPAVPLQELIAAASRTATAPGDEAGGEQRDGAEPSFVRHHPLQAFDERNFAADGPVHGGTFDTAALAGAEALRAFRTDPPAPRVFLDEPLPVQPVTAVTVDELVDFLQNPAREFLRRRLDLTVARDVEEINDALPIALDPLEQWDIGDRVLREVLDGMDVQDALDREATRGTLPPGGLGQDVRAKIATDVTAIADDRGHDQPRSTDIRLDLPMTRATDGPVRMTGVVGNVHDDTLWVRTYSTISAKHVAAAWVRLLALAAAEPDREHHAELAGKKGGLRLTSPSAADAEALLAELVQVHQSGMRFPMGVPPKTASAYASAYRKTRPGDPYGVPEALDRTRRTWEGDRFPGENDDPWWRLVLGTNARIEALNQRDGLAYFGPRIWNPIHDHGGEA